MKQQNEEKKTSIRFQLADAMCAVVHYNKVI